MKTKILAAVLLPLIAIIYLLNASWLRSAPTGQHQLLAHRGVHQLYSTENLKNDSCTADRIFTPEHRYLENTIESMDQAFKLGADIVELDIHLTSDGHFSVFHDWTIDCRTNGAGYTREHTLAYLKSLDIGWGYTHDGGKTFPFRGHGAGKIPSLTEVFERFPNTRLMINIKSNDPAEGEMLADYFERNPHIDTTKLIVYGGMQPTSIVTRRIPSLRGYTKPSVKNCVAKYMLTGALGIVPESCKNTVIMIPLNYSKFIWGWPRAFMQRMENAGTEVILTGNHHGFTLGIDDPDQMLELTKDFRGIVWTNKIEKMTNQGND